MAGAMVTSRRAAEIEPFEVMDVLSRAHELERAGRHVVHMEIGEPDFSAPPPRMPNPVERCRRMRKRANSGGNRKMAEPAKIRPNESTTCDAEFGRIQGERMGSSVDSADGAARALST